MTVTYDDLRWSEFAVRLHEALPPGCCNGTHDRTVGVLRDMGLDFEEVSDTLEWLKDRGGCCCGCEVLLNVVWPLADDEAGATP